MPTEIFRSRRSKGPNIRGIDDDIQLMTEGLCQRNNVEISINLQTFQKRNKRNVCRILLIDNELTFSRSNISADKCRDKINQMIKCYRDTKTMTNTIEGKINLIKHDQMANNSNYEVIKKVLIKKCAGYYEFENFMKDSFIVNSLFVMKFIKLDPKKIIFQFDDFPLPTKTKKKSKKTQDNPDEKDKKTENETENEDENEKNENNEDNNGMLETADDAAMTVDAEKEFLFDDSLIDEFLHLSIFNEAVKIFTVLIKRFFFQINHEEGISCKKIPGNRFRGGSSAIKTHQKGFQNEINDRGIDENAKIEIWERCQSNHIESGPFRFGNQAMGSTCCRRKTTTCEKNCFGSTTTCEKGLDAKKRHRND